MIGHAPGCHLRPGSGLSLRLGPHRRSPDSALPRLAIAARKALFLGCRILPKGSKLMSSPPIKALMTPEVAGTVWKENVKIADENNHPGKFTAFCSYEWT